MFRTKGGLPENGRRGEHIFYNKHDFLECIKLIVNIKKLMKPDLILLMLRVQGILTFEESDRRGQDIKCKI